MFLIKMDNEIKQTCSNCGAENRYSQKELEKVFPHSRERLKCKSCGHVLSVCLSLLY